MHHLISFKALPTVYVLKNIKSDRNIGNKKIAIRIFFKIVQP